MKDTRNPVLVFPQTIAQELDEYHPLEEGPPSHEED